MTWTTIAIFTGIAVGLLALYRFVFSDKKLLLTVMKEAVAAWGSINRILDKDPEVISKFEALQLYAATAVEAVEQMSTIDEQLINAPEEERSRLKKEKAMQAVKDMAETAGLTLTEGDIRTIGWLIEAAVQGLNFFAKKQQ